MQQQLITIFTDGSSLGNPGRGGWAAAIIFSSEKVVELGGHELETTNNRMELTAAIESLISLKRADTIFDQVEIHTDSAYVLNGITTWVYGWERNGWITSTKDPVLNRDLWQTLLELVRFHQNNGKIIFKKVKGHSGMYGNERVDLIATEFAEHMSFDLYEGTMSEYEKLIGGNLFDGGGSEKKKTKSKKSTKPAYSYVSCINGKVYYDATWAECERRVKGVAGAKYKKAMDKKEEAKIEAEFVQSKEL